MKPNAILEIITAKELLAKSNDDPAKTKEIDQNIEADAKDKNAKPAYLKTSLKVDTPVKAPCRCNITGHTATAEGGKSKRHSEVYIPFEKWYKSQAERAKRISFIPDSSYYN